ncbi:LNS2-domain-containing protein [Armillaria gallica]|uniref:LNS2-domain-containing protein n=1 Tax=Armillaria gallica TaxID=47427 RepID=A0A2H3E6B1_ARMGA|nr:LNS2-domain-containing protein [Armillaria gallica]
MNYIRGAVNAISAPYQYYKELPPINPSTLTGAIDVIVIQRPADNGGTELACSPFHVRFGKWQVLRPGEKKVNVMVNGHSIPFSMKIGDAGEAFFVFETDDDVPDDLITSPILQPTRPDGELTPEAPDMGLFGTKAESDDDELPKEEPDYLDLDAQPDSDEKRHKKTQSLTSSGSVTKKRPSRLSLSQEHAPPGIDTKDMTQKEQDERADEVLKKKLRKGTDRVPEVAFSNGIAYDIEGYHSSSRRHSTSHDRERSDRTIRSSDANGTRFPTSSRSSTPSPPRSGTLDDEPSSYAFPSIRATSEPPDFPEPPPDMTKSNSLPLELPSPSSQEYSWEWGAFPQPSPLKTTFGKSGRIDSGDKSTTWGKSMGKSKSKSISGLEAVEEGEVRSRSVPPFYEGKGKEKEQRVYEDYDGEEVTEEKYGDGGRLTVSPSDPTKFRVAIEGRRVPFELSLVRDEADEMRGRRNRDGAVPTIPDHTSNAFGMDEVETDRLFEKGKIDLNTFLIDESIIDDPALVINWNEGQYIKQGDGSPLVQALRLWRNAYLLQRDTGITPTRPSSPLSDDDEAVKPGVNGSSSNSETTPAGNRKPPTSSSWVQWWSRSRRGTPSNTSSNGKPGRPELRESVSVPLESTPPPHLKDIPPAESAPALPSTPLQKPVQDAPAPVPVIEKPDHKFAKTLRLTSDQLKSLNLKLGPNTITFSLSVTGAIACTARIFLWESTDLVLVSDIDGTITKSDGLGHVFAMIGRDWTHLGVAKLYTDICRNGYKIMYLTSRAIGQADSTRDYLKGIKQNDYQLPEGPVIMSPDRLMASLHREVIMRKPEMFKMACLRDIQRLFGEASRNPFYAGFGNRITDAMSYRSVNVPSSRIFTIDSTGEVKLELLELAGYKSSYIHMTDLVDQMFPPIHRKWAPEFTDFNYWKAPVQDYPLPDLSPPSPALSARSDTSNQSALARLRNFSLVGSRQVNVHRSTTSVSSSPTRRESSPEGELEHRLRQMSSFERLSSTLGFSGSPRRSPSPDSMSSVTYAESEDESDADCDDGTGKRKRRVRRRSMSSIPGALDDMHFELDDQEDDGAEDEQNEEFDEEGGMIVDEEAEEDAFDEDLLAAGEMKNVPFL